MGRAAEQGDLAKPAGLVTWWKHSQVLEHLQVDPRTLRARMVQTPDHIEPPWIDVGTKRRPRYRWIAERVDRWWIEVNRWRASTSNRTASTGSAGATRTAVRVAGPVRQGAPPVSSSARSRKRPPEDGDGSLTAFAKSRICA